MAKKYDEFRVEVVGTVLDVKHILPTEQQIAEAKAKGWREPQERFKAEVLYQDNSINRIVYPEYLKDPKLVPGKKYGFTLRLAAESMFINGESIRSIG